MNSTPASRNLEQHPYYFGLFANMARHNVYRILSEIAIKTETGKPSDSETRMWEADVINCLKKSSSANKENLPEKQRRVMEKLHEQFPFLRALNITLNADNPDYNKYYDEMRTILEQLENTRNGLSHAIHKPTSFNEEIIKWLEFIYEDGLKTVRKRIKLDDTKTSFLERYRGMDKAAKKPKLNTAFEFSFRRNGNITEKGLAFFISLFLEPEYTNLFLNKLNGFKKNSTNEEKAVHMIYKVNAAKLPVSKLESGSILLDMLNELGRCPDELYETLKEKDKKEFLAKAGTVVDESGQTDEQDNVVLKRHQFRFPYFALRYIDKKEIFEHLRFHVDLGNYHFNSYDKRMAGMHITRRWEKKLLGFGRLDEYAEEKRPKEYKALVKPPETIDDNTPAPFIVETNPHYHFMGNNIGIRNIRKPHKDKNGEIIQHSTWPAVETGKKAATEEPDYFLATDELVPLLVYSFLAREFNAPGAEDIITQYGKNTESFLKDFIEGEKIRPTDKGKITNKRSGSFGASLKPDNVFNEEYESRKEWLAAKLKPYNLQPHQVPETLQRHLMRIEPVNPQQRSEFIINYLLDETEKMLSRTEIIDKKSPDFNKKKERQRLRNLHLRAGDTALFLAKDLLYLQPPKKEADGSNSPKGKANPDEFQLLQARLAFFGRDKHTLKETFALCGLIDSDNPHPFLSELLKKDLDKCRDCRSFYITYLEYRMVYLERIQEKILKNKDVSHYHFLVSRNEKRDDDYFKTYAEAVKNKPTNIPRSIFRDALVGMLQQKKDYPWAEQLAAAGNGDNNVVFLINEWYKLLIDKYQPFYDFERNYRVVDEWKNIRPGGLIKPLQKHFLNTEDLTKLAEEIKSKNRKKNKDSDLMFYTAFGKQVTGNERRIRYYRAADQALLLMVKDLLSTENENIKKSLETEFKLQDISPTNEKSVLNRSIAFEQNIKSATGEYKTITATFKIKDYGKFRKDLKDKRLPALLDYYPDKKINKEELDRQLKDYERARITVAEKIYAFEKAFDKAGKYKEPLQKELDARGFAEHYVLLDLYLGAEPEGDALKEQLNEIRRKMMHNQFPAKEKMKGIINSEGSYINQIAAFAINWYEQAAQQLKQHG